MLVSTDDGSLGYKGFVTALLEDRITDEKFDIIYTCGPEIMMNKVVQTAHQAGVLCQVSLEQRMGCGIGACLACVCKIKVKADRENEKNNDNQGWNYKRVCKDGPVLE